MTPEEYNRLFNRETPPDDWEIQLVELLRRMKTALERQEALTAYFAESKTRYENEIAARRSRYPAPYSPETED